MRIDVKYIESREVIGFEKYDNLIISEGGMDMIRRA